MSDSCTSTVKRFDIEYPITAESRIRNIDVLREGVLGLTCLFMGKAKSWDISRDMVGYVQGETVKAGERVTGFEVHEGGSVNLFVRDRRGMQNAYLIIRPGLKVP